MKDADELARIELEVGPLRLERERLALEADRDALARSKLLIRRASEQATPTQ